MWLYGEFQPWLYDELDELAGTSYTQVGTAALTLSAGGAQTAPPIYDQPFNPVVGLYSETTQEYFLPIFYAQAGTAAITLTAPAVQRWEPAWSQAGTAALALAATADQYHGAAVTHAQTGTAAVTLTAAATQYHAQPPAYSQTGTAVVTITATATQSMPAVYTQAGGATIALTAAATQAHVLPAGAPVAPTRTWIDHEATATDEPAGSVVRSTTTIALTRRVVVTRQVQRSAAT